MGNRSYLESEKIHLKISYRNLKNILENYLLSQDDAKRAGFSETGSENKEENETDLYK